MLSLLIMLVVAVVIVILLFVAIDNFAGGIGGDGRLWLVLKGVILLLAVAYVLHSQGVLL